MRAHKRRPAGLTINMDPRCAVVWWAVMVVVVACAWQSSVATPTTSVATPTRVTLATPHARATWAIAVTPSTNTTPLTYPTPPTPSIRVAPAMNRTSVSRSGISRRKYKSLACILEHVDKRWFEYLQKQKNRFLLLRYDLSFPDRDTNPMNEGRRVVAYNPQTWIDAPTMQAQQVLTTVFSFYGVPPLVALSMVMPTYPLHVREKPPRCLDGLSEMMKLNAVLELLLEQTSLPGMSMGENRLRSVDEAVICHQKIERTVQKYAKFVVRCCYRASTGNKKCFTNITDKWLLILDILLVIVRLAGFFVGPVLIQPWMYTIVADRADYVVKLKDPLKRTVMVTCNDSKLPSAKRIIDLRHRRPGFFRHLRRAIANVPRDEVVTASVPQLDIRVDHSLLQTEWQPPVSMGGYIVRTLFFCQASQLGPFRDCCHDVACTWRGRNVRSTRWSDIFPYVGRIAFVLIVLPVFFYVRFALFLVYEYPELTMREIAAKNVKLPLFPDHRLMHYLPAARFVFITAYLIFVIGGIRLAYLSGNKQRTKFQHAMEAAYADMRRLDMLSDIGQALSRCLLPFRYCGVCGCLLALVFLPLFLPAFCLISIAYCLPAIYLTIRIVKHIFAQELVPDSPTSEVYSTPGGLFAPCRRISATLENALTVTITLLFLYSCMLLLSEVVGFVAEMMCLLLMGMIVQALKYASIIFLIVVYAFDCYNSVTRKYNRLNKELFMVIRERMSIELTEFISMPRYLRRYRAFKATQTSVQAGFETADHLTEGGKGWNINDLIFFIDQKDRPRMPRKLFDQVCRIDLPGSPGPPYRSILQATGRFLLIVSFLAFVFAVVFAFGDSFNVSTINQVLATLAGGFLPFLFNSVLRLKSEETTYLSVSFKCQLEEIITNFCQSWPMKDLRLRLDNDYWNSEELNNRSDTDDTDETRQLTDNDIELGTIQSDKSLDVDAIVDILVIVPDGECSLAYQNVATV